MPIEIELKASVEDHRSLKEQISLLSPPSFSFEKDDCYWAAGDGKESPLRSGVRLRRERIAFPGGETGEKTLVTYKVKEVRDGIEINDEREFSVPTRRVLRGCSKGWAWSRERGNTSRAGPGFSAP